MAGAQTWNELGGTNALGAHADILALAVDDSNNVYATGNIENELGYKYVAKWNGIEWIGMGERVGDGWGGINSLILDNANSIYVGGAFENDEGEVFVAKWDSTEFVQVGEGFNDVVLALTHDNSDYIYAGGAFTNEEGGRYVAKWDGFEWTQLGEGFSPYDGIYALTTDYSGNIYVAGNFFDEGGSHVRKWTGFEWIILGDGFTRFFGDAATVISLVADSANNIYAAGNFINDAGNTYVAKWDGVEWTQVGDGFDDDIYSLAIDDSSNIYAAGNFRNEDGGRYVAKWNGLEWTQHGGTFNDFIFNIALDTLGAPCIGGRFKNSSGNHFVATWGEESVSYIDSVVVGVLDGTSAVILDPDGTLQLEAVVYPPSASQNVIWSIKPNTGDASIDITGKVTAISDGTVWAVTFSEEDTTKCDSISITISNQITGIENINFSDMKIYPNPTNEFIILSTYENHPGIDVFITDVTGKIVVSKKFPANSLNSAKEINIIDLTAGTYYLQIQGSNVAFSYKLVKL